jgi:hypothetical protein
MKLVAKVWRKGFDAFVWLRVHDREVLTSVALAPAILDEARLGRAGAYSQLLPPRRLVFETSIAFFYLGGLGNLLDLYDFILSSLNENVFCMC